MRNIHKSNQENWGFSKLRATVQTNHSGRHKPLQITQIYTKRKLQNLKTVL